MKLYDAHQNISETIRGYIVSTACTVGASALLWGVATNPDYGVKALCATGSLTFGIVGRVTGKTLDDAHKLQTEWLEAISEARTSHIRRLTQTETLTLSESSTSPTIVPFDWRRLESERNAFAHLMLLGSTGDGKSVLAENLAGLFGGKVIGVIPHWEAGEFESVDLVIGEEANTGLTALPYDPEPEKGKSQDLEPNVTLDDILAKRVKPTVCQFLRALYDEMKRRFKLDPVTKKRVVGEPITVILDEYLSFAKLPNVDNLVMCLVREARKVNIRLILLVQGDSVRSLGWEGDGYIRENLTYIYLKDWAITQAKKLRDSKKNELEKDYWAELVKRLEADKYPTLVESNYAVRPNMNEYVSTSRKSTLLDHSCQYELEAEQMPNDAERSITVRGYAEQAEQLVKSVDTANPFEVFGLTEDAAFDLYDRAVYCSKLGWVKGKTIKEDWKYKSEKYRKGLEIWDAIEAHYGEIPRNTK